MACVVGAGAAAIIAQNAAWPNVAPDGSLLAWVEILAILVGFLFVYRLLRGVKVQASDQGLAIPGGVTFLAAGIAPVSTSAGFFAQPSSEGYGFDVRNNLARSFGVGSPRIAWEHVGRFDAEVEPSGQRLVVELKSGTHLLCRWLRCEASEEAKPTEVDNLLEWLRQTQSRYVGTAVHPGPPVPLRPDAG
jgi:hypothetical protein